MDALVSGRFLRVGLLLSLALLLSPYLYKFFAFVGSLVQSLRLDNSAIHVITIRHVGDHFNAGPVGIAVRIEKLSGSTLALWPFGSLV